MSLEGISFPVYLIVALSALVGVSAVEWLDGPTAIPTEDGYWITGTISPSGVVYYGATSTNPAQRPTEIELSEASGPKLATWEATGAIKTSDEVDILITGLESSTKHWVYVNVLGGDGVWLSDESTEVTRDKTTAGASFQAELTSTFTGTFTDVRVLVTPGQLVRREDGIGIEFSSNIDVGSVPVSWSDVEGTLSIPSRTTASISSKVFRLTLMESDYLVPGDTYGFDVAALKLPSDDSVTVTVYTFDENGDDMNSDMFEFVLEHDNVGPTVNIELDPAVISPTSLTAMTLTVTFSEVVSGFDIDSLDLDKASVSQMVDLSVGSRSIYELRINVISPDEYELVTAVVPFGVATDTNGLGNSASDPIEFFQEPVGIASVLDCDTTRVEPGETATCTLTPKPASGVRTINAVPSDFHLTTNGVTLSKGLFINSDGILEFDLTFDQDRTSPTVSVEVSQEDVSRSPWSFLVYETVSASASGITCSDIYGSSASGTHYIPRSGELDCFLIPRNAFGENIIVKASSMSVETTAGIVSGISNSPYRFSVTAPSSQTEFHVRAYSNDFDPPRLFASTPIAFDVVNSNVVSISPLVAPTSAEASFVVTGENINAAINVGVSTDECETVAQWGELEWDSSSATKATVSLAFGGLIQRYSICWRQTDTLSTQTLDDHQLVVADPTILSFSIRARRRMALGDGEPLFVDVQGQHISEDVVIALVDANVQCSSLSPSDGKGVVAISSDLTSAHAVVPNIDATDATVCWGRDTSLAHGGGVMWEIETLTVQSFTPTKTTVAFGDVLLTLKGISLVEAAQLALLPYAFAVSEDNNNLSCDALDETTVTTSSLTILASSQATATVEVGDDEYVLCYTETSLGTWVPVGGLTLCSGFNEVLPSSLPDPSTPISFCNPELFHMGEDGKLFWVGAPGEVGELSVCLDAMPASVVSLPLYVTDGISTTAPLSVDIRSCGWDSNKATFTVPAMSILSKFGDYQIVLGPTVSDDPAFDGVTISIMGTEFTDTSASAVTAVRVLEDGTVEEAEPVLDLALSGDTVNEAETTALAIRAKSQPAEGEVSVTTVTLRQPSAPTTRRRRTTTNQRGLQENDSEVLGISLSDTTIVWTHDNWTVPAVVTLLKAEDDTAIGDVELEVVVASEGVSHSLSITVVESDVPGIVASNIVDAIGNFGQTGEFSVALTSQPTDVVQLLLALSDTSVATIQSPATGVLVFSADNWDLPQAVVLVGSEDSTATEDVPLQIFVSDIVSDDTVYSTLPVPALTVDMTVWFLTRPILVAYEGFLAAAKTVGDVTQGNGLFLMSLSNLNDNVGVLIEGLSEVDFTYTVLADAGQIRVQLEDTPAAGALTAQYYNVTITQGEFEFDMGAIAYAVGSDICAVEGMYSCESCPSGATCPGGERTWPRTGFWSYAESDSWVQGCRHPMEKRCLGGQDRICGVGYVGDFCDACDEGYFLQFGLCQPCENDDELVVIFAFALAILAMLSVAPLIFSPATFDIIVWIVLRLQGLAKITFIASPFLVDWVREFYHYSGVVLFDLHAIHPACESSVGIGGTYPYYQVFLSALVAMVGICVPSFVAYELVWRMRQSQATKLRRTQKKSRQDREVAIYRWEAAQYRAMEFRVILSNLMLCLPILSYRMFQVFACFDDSSTTDLQFRFGYDMTETCFSGHHSWLFAVSIGLLLVLFVAFPAWLCFSIHRHGAEIDEDGSIMQLKFSGALLAAYRDPWFNFFVIEVVTTAAWSMSGAWLVGYPLSQLVLCGAFATAQLALLLVYRPCTSVGMLSVLVCQCFVNLVSLLHNYLSDVVQSGRRDGGSEAGVTSADTSAFTDGSDAMVWVTVALVGLYVMLCAKQVYSYAKSAREHSHSLTPPVILSFKSAWDSIKPDSMKDDSDSSSGEEDPDQVESDDLTFIEGPSVYFDLSKNKVPTLPKREKPKVKCLAKPTLSVGDDDDITIKWEGARIYDLAGYTIEWTDPDYRGRSRSRDISVSEGTQTVISNLRAGREYKVRVKPVFHTERKDWQFSPWVVHHHRIPTGLTPREVDATMHTMTPRRRPIPEEPERGPFGKMFAKLRRAKTAAHLGGGALAAARDLEAAQNQSFFVVVDREGANIGRSKRATIPLQYDRVSQRHAQIYYTRGRFLVRDLGSTNGTYVNRKRIPGDQEVELSVKDGVSIPIDDGEEVLMTVEALRAKRSDAWMRMRVTVAPIIAPSSVNNNNRKRASTLSPQSNRSNRSLSSLPSPVPILDLPPNPFSETAEHDVRKATRVAGGTNAAVARGRAFSDPGPSKMNPVSPLEVQDRAIYVAWQAVANVVSYRLEWRKGSSSPKVKDVGARSGLSHTFSGLEPNTEYRFRILPIMRRPASGEVEETWTWSDPIRVSTAKEITLGSGSEIHEKSPFRERLRRSLSPSRANSRERSATADAGGRGRRGSVDSQASANFVKSLREKSKWKYTTNVAEAGALVGRGDECDIRLPYDRVSSKHAKITYSEGGFWLMDLGSTNGTYLNGSKVERRKARLSRQDVISVPIDDKTSAVLMIQGMHLRGDKRSVAASPNGLVNSGPMAGAKRLDLGAGEGGGAGAKDQESWMRVLVDKSLFNPVDSVDTEPPGRVKSLSPGPIHRPNHQAPNSLHAAREATVSPLPRKMSWSSPNLFKRRSTSPGPVVPLSPPQPRNIPNDEEIRDLITPRRRHALIRHTVVDENGAFVGRTEENDIPLPFNRVSSKHAQFVYRSGHFWIQDLGSTNGTFWNGAALSANQQRVLKTGSVVTVPTSDFEVVKITVERVEKRSGNSGRMTLSVSLEETSRPIPQPAAQQQKPAHRLTR